MPELTASALVTKDKTVPLTHILKQMDRFFEFYALVDGMSSNPSLLLENIHEAQKLLDELIELHPLVTELAAALSKEQHPIALNSYTTQVLDEVLDRVRFSNDDISPNMENNIKLQAAVNGYFHYIDRLKRKYGKEKNILPQLFKLGVCLGFLPEGLSGQNTKKTLTDIKPLLKKMKQFTKLVDSEKTIVLQEKLIDSIQNPLAVYQRAWEVGFYSKELGVSLSAILMKLGGKKDTINVNEFISFARFLAEADEIHQNLSALQAMPAQERMAANTEAKNSILEVIRGNQRLEEMATHSIEEVFEGIEKLTAFIKEGCVEKIGPLMRDSNFLQQLITHPAFNIEHAKSFFKLMEIDEKYLTNAMTKKEDDVASKNDIKKLQKTVDRLQQLVEKQQATLEKQMEMLKLIANQQAALFAQASSTEGKSVDSKRGFFDKQTRPKSADSRAKPSP